VGIGLNLHGSAEFAALETLIADLMPTTEEPLIKQHWSWGW